MGHPHAKIAVPSACATRQGPGSAGTHVAQSRSMLTQPAASPDHVRDQLLADHRRLEDLFKQLLAAFAANDRERIQPLWGEFDALLTAHFEAEEKFLIPALAATNQRAASALYAEHEHLRARLIELGAGIDLHIVRFEAAHAFIDELRAHALHEDKALYRWADEHLSKADRALLLSVLVDTLYARLREIPRPAPLRS